MADSVGTSSERPLRRSMPGPLDPSRQYEGGEAESGLPHVVQMSIPEASTRADTLAWQQRAVGRGRKPVPAAWIARTVLALTGVALGAITVTLYVQDGFSRSLGFAGMLSVGYVALAYMLVHLRERRVEAE
ncbi:MAG TPA: hypothetical protein VGN05_14825, partial [Parvibaculum sp.]